MSTAGFPVAQLGAGALALEDEHGRLAPPNPEALAELLCAHRVEAVLLNACETHYQATLLSRRKIPCVIAAPTVISDQLALEYSAPRALDPKTSG